MEGSEINELMNASDVLREYNCGVYAKDQLPAGLPLGGAYVVNSQNSELPGRHWLSFWRNPAMNTNVVESWDSLGRPPSHYGIHLSGDMVVLYNNRRIQSDQSGTCGLHAVFFLYYKATGASMEQILDVFSEDKVDNDGIVTRFAERLKGWK